MFRSKNNSTTPGGGGGGGGGDNASCSNSSSLVPRFASLFFKKKQPKKRERPEIKLVLGDGGREGEKEGEGAPERRAKEEKDAANRHERERIVLLESRISATAGGDKPTLPPADPAAGPEDNNRRSATPSGTKNFHVSSLSIK